MDLSGTGEIGASDVATSLAQAPEEGEGELEIDQAADLRRRGRSQPRRAAHRFRQGHAEGPLSAARRILSGSVRPRRLGLCRRRRPRPARLRLYLEALVHALDPGPVQRRHRPRPAHLLLPQFGARQPRGHRRHLERECLARRARRRHRHLLGLGPRHRRAGRPQRQDQRDHPVRPGDGFADPGDLAGLAPPRLGRLLSRHLAPRDRGVPRDPQTLGRLQPQGAQPPPRRAGHRRVHGSGQDRRRMGAPLAQGRLASAPRSTPARCSRSWSRPGSRPASPTSSSSTR